MRSWRSFAVTAPLLGCFALACAPESTGLSSNIGDWSDEELQARLANLSMRPVQWNTWNCVNESDTPCTPDQQFQGNPSEDLVTEVYVRQAGTLKATVCVSGKRCIHADLVRTDADVSLVTENGLVLARFWTTDEAQLQGEMLAFGTYNTGNIDQPTGTTKWRGPVVVSDLTTTPAFEVSLTNAFLPMSLEFTQRVECESIRLDVRDETGAFVFQNLPADCSEKLNDAERGLRSHVGHLSIEAPGLWSGKSYTVTAKHVRGLQDDAAPVDLQAPVLFEHTPVLAPLDKELGLASFHYDNPLSCLNVDAQNLMSGETILPTRGPDLIYCRTQQLSAGLLQMVVDLPEGHRHISFQIASFAPPPNASEQQIERMHWKSSLYGFAISSQETLKVFEASEIIEPEVTPAHWSGWSTVRTRVPDGVTRVGLSFLVSCASRDAMFPGPDPASHCDTPAVLLLDNVHTEP